MQKSRDLPQLVQLVQLVQRVLNQLAKESKTMTALDLLWDLRDRGFTLREDFGKLLISPASQLAAADREVVKRHRDGILDALAAEPDRCGLGELDYQKLIDYLSSDDFGPLVVGKRIIAWRPVPRFEGRMVGGGSLPDPEYQEVEYVEIG